MQPDCCPVCGKPTDPVEPPFCSRRCRDVDLNRWLGGVYRVKTEEKPQDTANPEEDI